MNKYFKFFFSIILIISVCACGSYREKFGGYKYNHHLNAMESNSLSIRNATNVRPRNAKYNIPNINESAYLIKNVEALEKPKGF